MVDLWVAVSLIALLALLLGLAAGWLMWGRNKTAYKGITEFRDQLSQITPLIREEFATNRNEVGRAAREQREEVLNSFGTLSGNVQNLMTDFGAGQGRSFEGFAQVTQLAQTQTTEKLDAALLHIRQSLIDSKQDLKSNLETASQVQREKLADFATKIGALTESNESKHTELKLALQERLEKLTEDNSKKLDQMREVVDEKLQGTLEKRLNESFATVNDSLQKVYSSVGEMQSLAHGVGDLKKVLANVKARGNWGEVVLGNLLEDVLTPDQFSANVEIVPNSNQRVEFAVKLPGTDTDDRPLWLPIDAKFPIEDYERLILATEVADMDGIELHSRALEQRMRSFGKEISEKYVAPPHSTDFGILFLPTEALFAEIQRRPGLVSQLQNEWRIMVAGPTTLWALLSSLRMGFRTLAIQQRSGEVWQILGAVKTEFLKFGKVIGSVEKKLQQAQNDLAQVGVRSRKMNRILQDAETIDEVTSAQMLALPDIDDYNDDDQEEG
jgi:DNA recombination protein RmuC